MDGFFTRTGLALASFGLVGGALALAPVSAHAQQIPFGPFGLPIEGGPGITPGPTPPERPNPSDSGGRAVSIAYNSAVDLYDRTATSLVRALQQPCLDEDVREGLAKRANEAINQLRTLIREYSGGKYGGLFYSATARSWVPDLQSLLLKVAAKPICNPQAFPSSAPPPGGGGVLGGGHGGGKSVPGVCLTEEEIAKKIFEIDVEISKLQAEKAALEKEASRIAAAQAQNENDIQHFKAVISGHEDLYPDDPPDPKTGLADALAEKEALKKEKDANTVKQINVSQHIADLEDQKDALRPCPPSTGFRNGVGGAWYVGLSVGGESQSSSNAWNPNFIPPDNLGVASVARSTLNQTGAAVTGQIGADLRWGQAIFGGVFDATYKGGDPTRMTFYASPFGGVFPMRQAFASNFEITVRGRVGFELPMSTGLSITPYATAGLAVSQMFISDGMYFPTSFNYGAASQFRPGWAAGGGFEFRTRSPFRVQLQYLHMDFGDIGYTAPNAASPASFINTRHQISEDRATIGVNISFDEVPSLLSSR